MTDMTQLNRSWALDTLRTFLSTAELRYIPGAPNTVGFWRYTLVRQAHEVQAAAQVVEQILDRVLPGWRTAVWVEAERQPYWRHREATHRAIAQLKADQELSENLGDAAPQLDAATLHPWVWGSVQGLWSSGHYREAVGMASRAINAQAQAKLGRRDLSEGKLFSDAFTVKAPESDRPRLRLLPDDGSETFKNRHSGAADFARGLYSTTRNPGAHEVESELSENEALDSWQHLAFSLAGSIPRPWRPLSSTSRP
jgi:hypothetical protein